MPIDASSPHSPPPARKPERIRARQAKKLMIEMLTKYPIVEAACSKVGISRSTHYEWLKNDDRYRERIEQALEISVDTVNDIAENNIISGVKRGDYKSSAFWLKNRHNAYRPMPRATRAREEDEPIDLLQEALDRVTPRTVPSAAYRGRVKEMRYKPLTGEAARRVAKYIEPDEDDEPRRGNSIVTDDDPDDGDEG